MADGFLQSAFVEVVALGFAAARIGGEAFGGKDARSVPAPFAIGVGIFSFERVGEVDGTIAARELFVVQSFDALEVFLEWRDERIGEDGDAVLFAFAIADDDRAISKINVFDAQAHTFHQAQAATVEELRHQAMRARELSEDTTRLFLGEDVR